MIYIELIISESIKLYVIRLLYAITKKPLFGFVGDENEQSTQDIQFSSLDCIKLVDWSDRIIREDKRGAILSQRSRLLSSFGLDDDTWLSLTSSFGKDYQGAVGGRSIIYR